MKKYILFILVLAAVGGGLYFSNSYDTPNPPMQDPISSDIRGAEVIAENLKIPWDLAFLPDESLLVTERVGNLLHIARDNTRTNITIPRVINTGEGGLLGIILHPNFRENSYLYLYMTVGDHELGTSNAVIRYKFIDKKLQEEKIIVNNIPGAVYHDGGRMEFGPDGKLYITTGDATRDIIAQDLNSLGGKILRVNDDGSMPGDNPFNTLVYSYGHRNPQGLAWDSGGRLWETEHGRSGVQTGLDEINLIVPGKNYGWPTIEGDETKNGMISPVSHSGSRETWAPASALYWDGSLFFGGLRGQALYEAILEGERVISVKEHLGGQYGRIRTVRLGPDGMFYITTSNTDGRGNPASDDDKIIKVDPRSFR